MADIEKLYSMLDVADQKAQAGDEQAAQDAKEIYGMIQQQKLEKQKGEEFPPFVAGIAGSQVGAATGTGYGIKKGYDFLKNAGAVDAVKKYVAEKAQSAAPKGSVTVSSPTDIILAKDIDQGGTSGFQREHGKNILTEQAAAKAKEGEKLVQQIKLHGGMPASAPTNPLVNAPVLTPSPGGIMYPAKEAYAAEQATQAATNAPRSMGQRAMGALNTAKSLYNPVMKFLGPAAAGYQAGSEGVDAYNRFNRDDYIGGGLSAIAAGAGAAGVYPPFAPLAVPISAAASGANWARDEYLKRRGQPQMGNEQHAPQYATGGLVYLR